MGEAGGEEALSDLEAGDEMRLQAALQADMTGMVAIKVETLEAVCDSVVDSVAQDGEEALSDLDTALLDEAGEGALSDHDQPLQDDVAPEANDGEEALSDLDMALLDEAEEGALSDLDQPLQDDLGPDANDGDMSEMIEIDTYGEVDMENEMAVSDSGVDVDVVDLSSDEEEVQEDVSLVLLKRPPVMESHDATIDILDSDEEFPVCVGKWQLLDVSQTCL